ncbi:MAG: C-GCAxxG-C-C family protein [Candidatus Aquicultorales bacterium]
MLYGSDKTPAALEDRAEAAAARYFAKGFNCAQSVVMAAFETMGTDPPPALVRGTAAFTGGMGFAGCTCGALVGASLVLGAVAGDETRPRKNKKATDLSGPFHDRFKERFGSTCCRVLRQGENLRSGRSTGRCREITAITAGMVAKTLLGEKVV